MNNTKANATKNTHRLFFSLWPSEQSRQRISEILNKFPQQANQKRTSPENLHITLHFLGPVTDDVKACMQAAAQHVQSKSFTLNLDRYGHFSAKKILWLGSKNQSTGLLQLHKNLGNALTHCGYQNDDRIYRPHVTLMRNCAELPTSKLDFTIPWQANEFVLVESIPVQKDGKSTVNYRVIEKYPLLSS